MQIHVAGDLPKIASGTRLAGTAEEYARIIQRSIYVFGRTRVNEDKRTVTFHIASASFPNSEGEAQTRLIDDLTEDEFVSTKPNVAGGEAVRAIFCRREEVASRWIASS